MFPLLAIDKNASFLSPIGAITLMHPSEVRIFPYLAHPQTGNISVHQNSSGINSTLLFAFCGTPW
jgi:hypothetical protein